METHWFVNDRTIFLDKKNLPSVLYKQNASEGPNQPFSK